MTRTDEFYLQFRYTLLLTFFSGTYIPGMKIILPKYFPTMILFLMFFLCLSFNGIDYALKTTFYPEDLDFVMYFMMRGAVFLYGLGTSSTVFFILRRKEMQDLITIWCGFCPKLWPELRESALRNQKAKAWRKIKILLTCYLIPYVLSHGSTIFYGDLLTGTMLVSGKTLKASRLVVILQCLGGWSMMFWYTMLQCFFSTILRLILVELEYMEKALHKLFSTLRIRENGSIAIKPGDYQEMCRICEERLKILIEYHLKILRFAHQVEKIFGPIFFLQFFILSMLVSIAAYSVSTRVLSPDFAVILIMALGYFSFLCYLNCAIGGEIHKKSSRFVSGAFYANWWAYSMRIQKLLIPMIMIANQKPVVLNPMGLLPMVPETFASLTMFQYKFYNFLAETVHH